MPAIVLARQGESIPFVFDLGGFPTNGWTCTIYVKKTIQDPAAISREILPNPDGVTWQGYLDSDETAGLLPGLWNIYANLDEAATLQGQQISNPCIRFNLAPTVAT